jgi:hypothetical protein
MRSRGIRDAAAGWGQTSTRSSGLRANCSFQLSMLQQSLHNLCTKGGGGLWLAHVGGGQRLDSTNYELSLVAYLNVICPYLRYSQFVEDTLQATGSTRMPLTTASSSSCTSRTSKRDPCLTYPCMRCLTCGIDTVVQLQLKPYTPELIYTVVQPPLKPFTPELQHQVGLACAGASHQWKRIVIVRAQKAAHLAEEWSEGLGVHKR